MIHFRKVCLVNFLPGSEDLKLGYLHHPSLKCRVQGLDSAFEKRGLGD